MSLRPQKAWSTIIASMFWHHSNYSLFQFRALCGKSVFKEHTDALMKGNRNGSIGEILSGICHICKPLATPIHDRDLFPLFFVGLSQPISLTESFDSVLSIFNKFYKKWNLKSEPVCADADSARTNKSHFLALKAAIQLVGISLAEFSNLEQCSELCVFDDGDKQRLLYEQLCKLMQSSVYAECARHAFVRGLDVLFPDAGEQVGILRDIFFSHSQSDQHNNILLVMVGHMLGRKDPPITLLRSPFSKKF